jgi:hypothetical protein
MEAIETTGIIVNEKSIQLDYPIKNRGRIKLIILLDIEKKSHSLLAFAGYFCEEELSSIKSSIEEGCSVIDHEW